MRDLCVCYSNLLPQDEWEAMEHLIGQRKSVMLKSVVFRVQLRTARGLQVTWCFSAQLFLLPPPIS